MPVLKEYIELDESALKDGNLQQDLTRSEWRRKELSFVHWKLGRVYRRDYQFEKAIAEFDRANKLNPNFVQVLGLLSS